MYPLRDMNHTTTRSYSFWDIWLELSEVTGSSPGWQLYFDLPSNCGRRRPNVQVFPVQLNRFSGAFRQFVDRFPCHEDGRQLGYVCTVSGLIAFNYERILPGHLDSSLILV